MATRYTDVDLMILKRWEEVTALRAAFDELLGRMADVIDTSLERVSASVSENRLSADFDVKGPSIWFWKSEWENRKKEPGIYLNVIDFAPSDYGKCDGEYPSVWLMTDEFLKLRTRESSEEFARALRSALSPELL